MTESPKPNEKMPDFLGGADSEGKPKWYLKKRALLIAFAVAGPLMLPFVWIHPRMSLVDKIVWTVVIVGLTYIMISFANDVLQKLLQQYRDLGLIQ